MVALAGDDNSDGSGAPRLKAAQVALDRARDFARPGEDGLVMRENVLSRAVQAGDLQKVKAVLDAGADVRYERPHKYNVLIDVMHSDPRGLQLVPIVQLLIDRGAELNTVTPYRESALSVSSNRGRFDAVRVLLAAGADPAPLEWTPLMRAVALGSLDDVKAEIENGADLTGRDFWDRTAWLLSLNAGDVAKAKLLLGAGAARTDRGRCGKTPLMYSITNGHTEALRWLLSEGFDPNDADDFGDTPLMSAAEEGATECVEILIDAGADVHRVKHSWPAVKIAVNLDIVRLLVNAGADLNDISDEMRAALTKLPHDGRFRVTREEYMEQKHRRFGARNPQEMNFPFWKSMVTSGANAYGRLRSARAI
jgi:ankyrin repeat protein